jgi:hypothetical protein
LVGHRWRAIISFYTSGGAPQKTSVLIKRLQMFCRFRSSSQAK